VSHNQTS